MSDGSKLKTAVRALAAERRGGVHPGVQDLIAYAMGSLSVERHDEVEEHLATCAECARLVVDYADFDELGAPDGCEPVTAADVAAARARFAVARRLVASSPRPDPASSVSSSPAPLPPARTWQLLAAGLAVAVVGLTVWGVSEHLSLRRLRQPEANVVTLDLEPEGSDQVRGGPAAGPTVVDGSAGTAVLILELLGAEGHSGFRAAILDSRGQVEWSSAEAARDPKYGNFTLRLPPGALPPGRYTIEILGTDDAGRETSLARYPIQVR